LNLALFLSGKSISLFGSAIYTFVVGLYLLRVTGSGLTFATNIVLYTLPIVFINPFAGVLADKMKKKVLIVGADLINGVFLFVVYLLAIKFGLSIPLVYISTFLMTVLSTFFNIGIESAKPRLVSKESLVKINSLARVIESFSYLIGPVAGGLIYSLIDTKQFILLNAISFILAAFLEYFINYKYNSSLKTEEQNDNESISTIWEKLKEGYNYLFQRPHLKSLIYVFIALNFFFNFTVIVPLPYLLNTIWEVNSTVYGIVQGGLPVGMITGALLVNKVLKNTSYNHLLKKIGFYSGVGVLAFAFPLIMISGIPSSYFITIYYTILMFLGGLVVAWVDIPASVLLQKVVPENILGRVISVKLSIIKTIVPITLILSGYLLELISPIYIILIGAGFFLGFNFWFFILRRDNNFVNLSSIQLVENSYK
jgi:MFS family permease